MLKQILYQHFKEIKDEDDRRVRSGDIHFSPSSVNACRRQIYYKWTNTMPSNPMTAHTYIKFWLGDITHEGIQKILKDRGYWVEGEEFKKKEMDGLLWVYRHDGMVEKDKAVALIEIKSTYMSGFNAVKEKPKDDHLKQLLMYMKLEKIDKGELLYIGRDNGFIVEYIVHDGKVWKDDGIMGETEVMDCPPADFERLIELKQMIQDRKIPERDCRAYMKNLKGNIVWKFQKNKVNYKTDWQCSYCQWRDLCWEEEKKIAEVEGFFI